MAAIVTTIRDRCKRCYSCIRSCPAKAIKVEDGQAKVMEERCITCGNCYKVCAQGAKQVQSSVGAVREMLRWKEPVIAAIAPSFPASFDGITPGQVIGAVKMLGFDEVMEVAFGAELVSREYVRLADRQRDVPIITTPCPAAVTLIQKFYPALIPFLAPIVSPAIALGRAIKTEYRPDARVVFVGPCIAKKAEIHENAVAGAIDEVLTFAELKELFRQAGISIDGAVEGEVDGPRPRIGRIYPLQGGLLRTAAMKSDVLESDIVVIEGKDNVLRVLREMADGKLAVRFLDILFCEGCIDGPVIESDHGLFARRQLVSHYVQSHLGEQSTEQFERTVARFSAVDLSRGFEETSVVPPSPSDGEIDAILRQTGKMSKADELNCGACGYGTCREKATAVYQGLAELEMCLPYLLDRFQLELQAAQDQLVQSEKLASMGQLAAGVAHEINNPLGTIMIYASLLLKEYHHDDQRWSDLKLIVEEAERCRSIVSGLLEFARQGKLELRQTDLNVLLQDVVAQVNRLPCFDGVTVSLQLDTTLPTIAADPAQLRGVFSNIVVNAAEAMPDGGRITISSGVESGARSVWITVADTGCGIAEENLRKLFVPFFTTKEIGKGTGLGLAIAYGIVKMHRGTLDVQSKLGQGSSFTVTLPVEGPQGRSSAKAMARGQLIGDITETPS
ncbi:MAG TPA: [Fe-Fe] hydrogenase large subunit C-terminal domain-containing protein [Chloroflexota bacterium]|nr:[Fe-Fe] hydrogenase large subunit C-terminal domain-containing protein [Chloroflexota bacterium]